MTFHAVSHLEGVEARPRAGWPPAVFIVGRPTAPLPGGGEVKLREEEQVECGEYVEAVEEAKRALERGELFQLVLSRYRAYRGLADPAAVLKKLIRHMDSKYYYFFQFGEPL
ncbi:TPA: hypothetical protein HA333_07535 [Pyrobaculum aerophilum]|uniref:Uncharacterized protein n=1 Tax=Pyrobaculum aerophilum TaxID=13773 RepID=A0A832T2E3_9CREN|nr:hypothetical protein [Pyrobaculum aerophilum]